MKWLHNSCHLQVPKVGNGKEERHHSCCIGVCRGKQTQRMCTAGAGKTGRQAQRGLPDVVDVHRCLVGADRNGGCAKRKQAGLRDLHRRRANIGNAHGGGTWTRWTCTEGQTGGYKPGLSLRGGEDLRNANRKEFSRGRSLLRGHGIVSPSKLCGWHLVVGGGWWLAVGGWWRVAGVGGWWGLAVGGWRAVVVGSSWRLAVGGPWGLSLRAVLNQKKIRLLKKSPDTNYL